MADPNRPPPPVTGYPAPNAHGYSAANPPPSGTGYPYAAPQPPPNAYYQTNPYYNQQNYQNDPDSLRRATCLRRIFAFIIGLIIIFGTITFIVWLVLRPQLPEFRINSFTLSNFTISNSSLITFTSEIRLTARNPNKKMTLRYDHIEAGVFYRSDQISDTTLAPFSQDTKSETPLAASFASAGRFVDQKVVDGVNNDRAKNGNVNFNFRLVARVRFDAKAWRTRRRFLRVFCGDLFVGIPRNGSSGALTGAPRQCRVGI